MKYIVYKELNEFYPISSLCDLFGVDKKWIRYVCEKHKIEPEYVHGECGFSKLNATLIHQYLMSCYSIFYNESMFSKEWSPIWD